MPTNHEHAGASLPNGAASVSLNSLSSQNPRTDEHPTGSVPQEISPLVDWAHRHAAAARAVREEHRAVIRPGFLGGAVVSAQSASSIRTRQAGNSISQLDDWQHADSRPSVIRRSKRGDTNDATLPYVVVSSITRLVQAAGFGIAGVLVLHILFVLLRANPDNGVGILVSRLSGVFSLGLSDLFTLANPTLSVIVNTGASVIAWLGMTATTGALLRRFLKLLSTRGHSFREHQSNSPG